MAIPPIGVPASPPPAPAPAASRSFGELLERSPARVDPGAAGPPAASARGPVLSALANVDVARRRLDAILEAARAGRTFTAQELLGLQAQAYRYAQMVDLASKLVESGAQSVKQALNTQV